MAECAGLENRCTFTGTEGSNPSLSALFSGETAAAAVSPDFFYQSVVHNQSACGWNALWKPRTGNESRCLLVVNSGSRNR